MKKIFSGWFIADRKLSQSFSAEQLIKHYKELSLSLGINQPIPTPAIKPAIRYFYRQKITDRIPAFIAKVKKELPASEQGFILMQASYVGHFDSPEAALKILKDSESRFGHSIEYLKSIASTYQRLGNSKLAFSY